MLPICLVLLSVASLTEAGVSFVRWGRTVCPAGTYTLYKGYMAGSKNNVGGSGSNYLCMDEKPQFVNGVANVQGTSGLIVGVEMEYVAHFKKAGLFKLENIPGGELHNEDLPCVRCYVSDSSDVMMLPGRQDCGTSGYELQYKGFLVSEMSSGRARGEFVCLDEAPEGRSGGAANDNQAVVYPVEVGAGSLPSNPYVNGMEATCAICTY